MKPRKNKDLLELSPAELDQLLNDSEETYSQQIFQHSLKQLHDTAYLRILKRDIARIKTILNERKRTS
jgi:large subunit ribosomal protein L29